VLDIGSGWAGLALYLAEVCATNVTGISLRFLVQREQVERLYDARFVRMGEFYLAASEMAFREQDMMFSKCS
jgi:cyclopropane fatty-acyl-phospholipid synthase-like methyltransferase